MLFLDALKSLLSTSRLAGTFIPLNASFGPVFRQRYTESLDLVD